MTPREARQRVTEMWGEMGLVARLIAVLTAVTLLVGLTSAFKVGTEWWLVPQTQLRARDDSLNAFFNREQLRQIRRDVDDSVFKLEMRTWRYQDCVRRNGESACLHIPK